MNVKTLHTVDTEHPADSIEWCPHPDYCSYFVCGTYQLEGNNSESTSPPCRRNGRILLYKYCEKSNILSEVFRLNTAAILDMKWLHNSDPPTLAIANALGEISVYILQNGILEQKDSIQLDPKSPNLLALSLDWEWKPTGENRIVASDSKGEISLLAYTATGLRRISSWSGHSFEAWICAFDKWIPNCIFTGGDDTFLHVFDVRDTSAAKKVLTNKSHLAGVTSLLSHPIKKNILLTGSYDENVRVFDTSDMKEPISSINLKGGIWRLKPDLQDRNLVLSACMYKNFSIVKLSDDNRSMDLVGEYNEHSSICYGADWSQCKESGSERMIMATCSFYDNKMCVSEVTE